MPRVSPYSITLDNPTRARLEAIARSYTLPYRDVIRAKIALYAADGLGNDVIGARLDTPRQIVCKWRKRFFEEGLAGLEERPRVGRPARFPPPASSSPLRPSPASFPTRPDCRYPVSASPRSSGRCLRAAWWRTSARPPSGGG